MANRDDFKGVYDTLALDETVAPEQTIRHSPSHPTLALTELPPLAVGTETNPELELGATIGEGGMGIVRQARQKALVREVAVKTLRDDRHSEATRAALLHEALVTGGLEHPNVVPIYTLGQTEDGAPVIVMKRIEGTPWSEVIDAGATPPGFDEDDPLGWHLDIFAQVCLAAHFAHSRDIVHRDIKPENVMIGAYGEVYLLDWGIAVTTDETKAGYLPYLADSSGICGTPHYMAPEMTDEEATRVSARTDVYLLGATLYHALTGDPPHDGESLFEVMFHAYEAEIPTLEGVPDELEAIVGRAMARDPEDRFASADALRQAVVEFQEHRASIALTDEAMTSLEQLHKSIASDEDEEAAIRNLFGECRFGFRQALRVWPDNPDANRGLRDALAAMIGFELSIENAGAARALLGELDSEAPELQRDLDRLEERLAERREELEALRELERESDLSAGARPRSRAAIFTAVLWAVVAIASELVVETGIAEFSAENYFYHGFVLSGFLGVVIWCLRDTARQNRANLALLRVVFTVALLVPIYRGLSMVMGVEPGPAITLECLLYAMGLIGLGILSNRWAWFGGGSFVGAAVVGAFYPEWLFEAYGVANFLALGWLYLIWRPTSEEADEKEDPGA